MYGHDGAWLDRELLVIPALNGAQGAHPTDRGRARGLMGQTVAQLLYHLPGPGPPVLYFTRGIRYDVKVFSNPQRGRDEGELVYIWLLVGATLWH